MKLFHRFSTRIFPANTLPQLSDVDQIRFNTLLYVSWFMLFMIAILTIVNIYFQKYDRVVDGLLGVSVYAIPSLWLACRYRLRAASWWMLSGMYVSLWRGLAARIMAHADVHLELQFLMIGLLSIVLLERRVSLILSVFLLINFLVARALVIRYLNLPFEIGQFLNGFGVFSVQLCVGYIVKWTIRKMGYDIAAKNKLLADQNQELTNVNILKDKLFGIIGHDLRSPISSLKAQLLGLSDIDLSSAQLRQNYGQFAKMLDATSATLDNLLYWSLIQQRRLPMVPTSVYLEEIAESVCQLHETVLQTKQITVHTRLHHAPVCTDEQQVQIVVRNIVQNAIKFTPAGGQLWLTSFVENNQAVLTVRDSGIGMPADALRITPGDWLHAPNPTDGQGVGLGLEICRELLRHTEGQLIMQSTPGQGTTVTLRWAVDPAYQSETLSAVPATSGHAVR